MPKGATWTLEAYRDFSRAVWDVAKLTAEQKEQILRKLHDVGYEFTGNAMRYDIRLSLLLSLSRSQSEHHLSLFDHRDFHVRSVLPVTTSPNMPEAYCLHDSLCPHQSRVPSYQQLFHYILLPKFKAHGLARKHLLYHDLNWALSLEQQHRGTIPYDHYQSSAIENPRST